MMTSKFTEQLKCKLNSFFYITLDFQGNIVVVSDCSEYPDVIVDDDCLITFKEENVTEFTKPETKLIFEDEIHEITW